MTLEGDLAGMLSRRDSKRSPHTGDVLNTNVSDQDGNGRFQRRQITLHDSPNQCEIHAEVVVRETIAHARDLLPWDLRGRSFVLSASRLTASPMISSLRMTASWRIRSAMKASRPAEAYSSMSVMASRM